jgi:hypothetical protein
MRMAFWSVVEIKNAMDDIRTLFKIWGKPFTVFDYKR